MESQRKQIQDRRKGPDLLLKVLRISSAAVWGVLFLILIFIDRAKPDFENFYSHLFGVKLRLEWDMHLLTGAFILSLILFVICLFSLYLNSKRHRRKTDRYSRSVILNLIFSFAIIIFYLVKSF